MNLVERLRDELTDARDRLWAAERVVEAARRYRARYGPLATVGEETTIGVDLDEALAAYDKRQNPAKPHSRSQAIRFAVQRGEPVPSFDKSENPDSAERMPDHLAQRSSDWLVSNEKRPTDVRWGRFPLGMVQRWIERAEAAERKLAEAGTWDCRVCGAKGFPTSDTRCSECLTDRTSAK